MHRIDDLRVELGVRVSELPAHVPEAVLQKLNESSLLPSTLRWARKHLAMWSSGRRFHASVVASGRAALYFEDDAILQPGFCESVTRVLRAAPATFDLLFLGHCAESIRGIRNCRRVDQNETRRMWLSRGVYPMCGHAFIASPRGSARWLASLADWPREYVEKVLRTAVSGWETPGEAKRRRPEKRPVDDGVDVSAAKLIYAGSKAGKPHLEAYLAWPQLALQPWMLASGSSIAKGTRDLDVPRICKDAGHGSSGSK